jgi:hypothetical protein
MAHLPITSNMAYLVGGSAQCRHCRRETEVFTVFCEQADTPEGSIDALAMTQIDDASGNVLALFESETRLCRDGAAATVSYVNHCRHCGTAVPNNELFDQPGAVFFPTDDAEFGRLQFLPIGETVVLKGNWTLGPIEEAFVRFCAAEFAH